MTVASEVSSIAYTGDGATKTFAVPFLFYDAADLTAVIVSTDGETPAGSFSADGVGVAGGGSITFTAAPASGAKIRIDRDPPITQITAYTDHGRFPASSHERALDRAAMVSQAIEGKRRDLESRALRLKPGASPLIEPIDATDIGNKFMYASSPTTIAWVTAHEARTLIGAQPDGTLPNAPMTGPALPEGAIAAAPGYTYARSGVDADISAFLKRTGMGPTGWAQVETSPFIDIRGDGSDETAKFAGKRGRFRSNGRTVRVSSIPAGVDSPDTFWRMPSPEGATTPIDWPSDRGMLPATSGVILLPHAYAGWSEDTGHTMRGDCCAFGHIKRGGHGDSEPCMVVRYRVNIASGRASYEVLWRPDDVSPLGYNCAAGGAIGMVEYALITPISDPAGNYLTDRAWKLMRRIEPHRVNLPAGAISTVEGATYMTISNALVPDLRVPSGAEFTFANGPGTIGGNTLDSSTVYVVTKVSNANYRFRPKGGAFPVATSTESGGTLDRISVRGNAFSEVLFTGGKSWGEALLDRMIADGQLASGTTQQPPYPTGNGFRQDTVGNSGVGTMSGSFASNIHFFRMGGLLNAGTPEDPAGFRTITGTPSFPTNASQGAAQYFEHNGLSCWAGICRVQSAANGPILWLSTDDLATEPQFRELPKGGGVNTSFSVMITPDQGNGRRLQMVAPTTRDPGDAYTQIPLCVWDISLEEMLADLSTAKVRRIGVEWIDTISHNGQNGTGPNPNGVGTICPLPGDAGICAFMAFQIGHPAYNNNNFAGHRAVLIDTQKLTGAQKRPSLTPPTRAYPETDITHLSNINMYTSSEEPPANNGEVPGATAIKLIRYRKAHFDLSLGDYSTLRGYFEARMNGRWEFDFKVPAALDGTDFVVSLWDVTADAEYVPLYGPSPYPLAAYMKGESGTGFKIVSGRIKFDAITGQRIGLYVRSGTVFTAGPTADASRLSTLEIRRLG